MAISHTKTCPECGAANDANDLFCKDCGGSLAMVTANAGQTSTFTPIPQPDDAQTTAVAPAIAPQPMQPHAYAVSEMQPSYGTVPPQESPRGAVLGWLAATLFLLIVAFFVWSSLLSDAARDRFTGFF